VAGLALIDSSHPDMYKRLPAGEWFSSGRGELLLVTIRERLIPLGLVRLADDLGIRRQVTDRAQRIYPPDAAAAGRAFLLSSRQRRAAVSELAHLGRSCNQARPYLTDLGTMPLAVLTSSEHDPSDAPGSPADRKRARWYATWSVLQAEFSGLSRNSRHTVAGRAGHHIHRDDPELVADTLRDLVSRARRQGTAQPTALRLSPCTVTRPLPRRRLFWQAPHEVTACHGPLLCSATACADNHSARPPHQSRRFRTDHDRQMLHGCDRPAMVASPADSCR
jgi:hypothetical protein